MTGLSDVVVQELRRSASDGVSVPDLLRLLIKRLGPESAYGTTLARYFMTAFQLPLQAVAPIGGWSPDSIGEISDGKIQELLHPEILRQRRIWERLEAQTD